MRRRDLQNLGIERGEEARLAMQAYQDSLQMGMTPAAAQAALEMTIDDPLRYEDDSLFGELARVILARQDGETLPHHHGPSGRREEDA